MFGLPCKGIAHESRTVHWETKPLNSSVQLAAREERYNLLSGTLSLSIYLSLCHSLSLSLSLSLSVCLSLSRSSFLFLFCSLRFLPSFLPSFLLFSFCGCLSTWLCVSAVCSQKRIRWLFIAHQLEDAIETFMMRFARSSGVMGLPGK